MLSGITYPSTIAYNGTVTAGPSYSYSFDNMSRLSGMMDSNNNAIVNDVSYDAANHLLTIGYNSSVTETRSYNVLGQLTSLTIPMQSYGIDKPEPTRTTTQREAITARSVRCTIQSAVKP